MIALRMLAPWLGRLLCGLVVLAAAVAVVVAVLVPRATGGTPYTIRSGSMAPALPPGTLVVVHPVAAEDISIGDVITYQRESGRPDVVTHRVVGRGVNTAGETVLQTQGDANDTPDRRWVRAVQVRGEQSYAVPCLGYVNALLTGQERQWAVNGVALLLLGYAGVMLAASLRDRRRDARRPAHTEGRP